MRRCVWSRNLKNEEAMARVGPQRHREEKNTQYEARHHAAEVVIDILRKPFVT